MNTLIATAKQWDNTKQQGRMDILWTKFDKQYILLWCLNGTRGMNVTKKGKFWESWELGFVIFLGIKNLKKGEWLNDDLKMKSDRVKHCKL